MAVSVLTAGTGRKILPHHRNRFFGLNTTSPTHTSEKTGALEASDIKNVALDRHGGTKVRKGRSCINSGAQLATYIHSMFWFKEDAGTDHLLLAAGAKIYDDGGGAGTPAECTLPITLTSDQMAYGDSMSGFFFYSNGSDVPIKYDGTDWTLMGVTAPAVAPTLADSSPGTLDAAEYNYCYMYVYKNVGLGYEAESAASPIATITVAALAQVNVTVVASAEAHVSYIRIFRRNSIATTWQLVVELANANATYSDTIPDASLGREITDMFEGVPAVTLNCLTKWKNRLWGIAGTKLYNTVENKPEVWWSESSDWIPIELGELAQFIFPFKNSLIVWTTTQIKILYGDSEQNFTLVPFLENVRLAARRPTQIADNKLRFLTLGGLYEFDGVTYNDNASEPINEDDTSSSNGILDSVPTALLYADAYWYPPDRTYVLSVPYGSSLYNSRTFVDYYDMHNKDDISSWSKWEIAFGAHCVAPDGSIYTTSWETGREGYYYEEYSGTTDDGTAISWYYITRDFDMEDSSFDKRGLFIDGVARVEEDAVNLDMIVDFGAHTQRVIFAPPSGDVFDGDFFDAAYFAGPGRVEVHTSCDQELIGQYISFKISSSNVGGIMSFNWRHTFEGRDRT